MVGATRNWANPIPQIAAHPIFGDVAEARRVGSTFVILTDTS
jgi:hypothetical protein